MTTESAKHAYNGFILGLKVAEHLNNLKDGCTIENPQLFEYLSAIEHGVISPSMTAEGRSALTESVTLVFAYLTDGNPS
jgi:hypothetical protein